MMTQEKYSSSSPSCAGSLLPASYKEELHKIQMQLFLQKLKVGCISNKNKTPISGLLREQSNTTLLLVEGFPEALHSFFIIVGKNVEEERKKYLRLLWLCWYCI